MKSRGHKTFDHTADVGIEAWGESFEAVFEEAAKALFGLMVDLTNVQAKETLKINLAAENGEELLLKWLKELLYLFDTKHLLLSEFKITRLDFKSLQAEAKGEQLNSSKHDLGREVKAVTHHQFEFKKTSSGFNARFIVDI